MFNLENAIAEWGEEMFASGIGSSALDELETHLRDEIERHTRRGWGQRDAFEMAVRAMGPAKALRSEFKKITSPTALGFAKNANHILVVLWFAGCLWSLVTVCRQFFSGPFPDASFHLHLLSLEIVFIYVAGMIGSVLLFWGARMGRAIVRMIALLFLIVCIAQSAVGAFAVAWRVWCIGCAFFCLISIWLLHRPDKLNSTT